MVKEHVAVVLLTLSVAVFQAIPSAQNNLQEESYRVTSGQVTATLPMTIGGSFEAKTTALSGTLTPAAAGSINGAVLIELSTFETGISLRDRHLRNNYFEVQRGAEFAVAKLENIKVERLSGKSTFRGTLMLHGVRREISGTADVQSNGRGYRLNATFPLRISDFKIPEPQYLGVGVTDEISIQVALGADPAGAIATGTTGIK